MTFKRTKIRYADQSNGLTYFNHPFADGNKIRLIDDVYLNKSLSEESLSSDLKGVQNVGKKGRSNVKAREEEEKEADLLDLSEFAAGKKNAA